MEMSFVRPAILDSWKVLSSSNDASARRANRSGRGSDSKPRGEKWGHIFIIDKRLSVSFKLLHLSTPTISHTDSHMPVVPFLNCS